MLNLGGPNAAVMAPPAGSPLASLFAPILDTADLALGTADQFLSAAGAQQSLFPKPPDLGLSLGSHGLGVTDKNAPGTLAGTLTGAARRAVYAARIPTNEQRAVSLLSAAVSTAVALAQEANRKDRNL